jgi:hypothetical protein
MTSKPRNEQKMSNMRLLMGMPRGKICMRKILPDLCIIYLKDTAILSNSLRNDPSFGDEKPILRVEDRYRKKKGAV